MITPSGKITTLAVLSNDNVKSVKDEIYEKEGMPLDEQRLMFDGEELEGGSLIENDIKNGSIIRLVRRVAPIANRLYFIKTPTGKTIRVEFDPETSIKDVKDTIQEKEEIPADQQHLIFRDQELTNERSLSDCNIPKGEFLHLKLNGQ